MKQLVIFDLDGTLLNTIADLATATNHALEACGFPTHATDVYKNLVGGGITKLFERALPEDMRTPKMWSDCAHIFGILQCTLLRLYATLSRNSGAAAGTASSRYSCGSGFQ